MSNDVAKIPQNKYNLWELVANGLINEDDVSDKGVLLPTLDIIKLIPKIKDEKDEKDDQNIYINKNPVYNTDNNKSNNVCVICLSREKKYATTPCRHFCLCELCCKKIDKCPICRKKNIGLIRIYN